MCGFAGVANISRVDFAIDESTLQQMHQRMAHRGPDSSGVWQVAQHEVALVNRRLKIIDISDAGRQPMLSHDKRVVISFNGEIYNYKILKQQLVQLGYQFHSDTDTEVVIYAYQEWGIESLSRLDGMFAFALYDTTLRELFIVRDRIGVKPAYFSLQGGALSFASEIKALWALPWMKKEFCETAFYHYLTFMVAPAPLTMFQGVYKLPAGMYLKLDASKNITFHEWYDPLIGIQRQQQVPRTENEYIDQLDELLCVAVKKRLHADVPVGAFLSGGIDSSLIVALMAQQGQRVKTFTVAFSDGPELNELQWAHKVAQHFNTEHHEITIGEQDARQFFSAMNYYHDEPLADCVSIPLYHVARCAKEQGVTVALIGEGADELFFGYPVYGQYAQFYQRWFEPTQKYIPSMARRGAYHALKPLMSGRLTHYELLNNWAHQRALFWGGAIAYNEQQKAALLQIDDSRDALFASDPILQKIMPTLQLSRDSHALIEVHRARLRAALPYADFGLEMAYLELKQRLPELLLMRADKMTMAASVEGRVPFLDYQLVEFALAIPLAQKFKGGVTKYLLKKVAERYLPHEVIYRTKVGFGAPIVRWYKQGYYFPSHYAQLVRQHSVPIAPEVLDRIEHMQRLHGTSDAVFAVQKWVLHNVLAMEFERDGATHV